MRERRSLGLALGLNAVLAGSLFAGGLIADSSGLTANALDNASDAGVYGIGLFAISRGVVWRLRAARVSGIMLLVLSAGVIVDVARRFVAGAEPASLVMIVMAVIAITINAASLFVLRALDRDEVHLRATWTFSMNDFMSNVGVLLAAALVGVLDQAWPDLVAGLAIATLAAKGGVEILRDAGREQAKWRHARPR
jgi:Co/Zn/Cd efflux system component